MPTLNSYELQEIAETNLIVVADPNVTLVVRRVAWERWADGVTVKDRTEKLKLSPAMPLKGYSRRGSRTTPDMIWVLGGNWNHPYRVPIRAESW